IYSNFHYTDAFLVLDARIPKIEFSPVVNTWEREAGGDNNYILTFSADAIPPSHTVKMDLYREDSKGNRAPILDAGGEQVSTSVRVGSGQTITFTDINNLLTPGYINRVIALVMVTDKLRNKYTAELPFDLFAPKWVTTDRVDHDTDREMFESVTTISCAVSDTVKLNTNNTNPGSITKHAYWEFVTDYGAKTRYGEADGSGSALYVNGAREGTYTYCAFSDKAGTKLLYKSNSIKILCADSAGYTVKYDPNGGKGSMTQAHVLPDEKLAVPACSFTPPAGQVFKCWVDGSRKYYKAGDMVSITQDTTLKAVWTGPNVTVEFLPGDGSGTMATITAPNDGSKIKLPECTFTPRHGYEFYYWEDEVGHWYGAGYELTPTRTSYTMTALYRGRMCTITFDPNGGTVDMDPAQARYGTQYTLPACTIHPPAGKAFFSYSVNGTYGYAQGDQIPVMGDTVVKVIWSDAEFLDAAYCTIGAPVAGEHPDRHPVSLDSDKYTVELDSWQYKVVELEDGETFEEGKNYFAYVWFYPRNGYTFDKKNTSFYINGKKATCKGGPVLGGFYVCLEMGTSSENTIARADATMREPTPGWRPQDINVTIESADPERYTVSVLRWYKQVTGTMVVMDKADHFIAGGSYSPILKFTPVGDHSFNIDTVYTINGMSVTKDPYKEEWVGVTFKIADPEGGTLSGKVTSYLDSTAPITLKLYESGSNSPLQQKNVAGDPAEYSFEKAPAGNYVLAVFKDGHVSEYRNVTIDGDVTLNVTIYPIGDVNGDGDVNMKDVLLIRRAIAGLVVLTPDEERRADVNYDNNVDMKDVLKLRRA
ncbi:MAG: dockerin type I repeat-containing protein, partial [Clostridia bacterium]|nr:dockerin type I repeat-containing protein [Clostridia bacterium]